MCKFGGNGEYAAYGDVSESEAHLLRATQLPDGLFPCEGRLLLSYDIKTQSLSPHLFMDTRKDCAFLFFYLGNIPISIRSREGNATAIIHYQ